jgi:hypothetical protein
MSRIEGKQHLQATQDLGSNKAPQSEITGGAQTKSEYVANNDSPRDKFCAHEGIDRGRGNKHGLHGKKVGDKADFSDGATTLTGTVLKDNGDSLLILVGEQVYTVGKENGKSRGHRKASNEEMQQYAQIQLEQQEQARIQEQQSARIDESIKQDNKKHDTQLYNKKIEQRAEYSKKVEARKNAVQSLSNQYQHQVPKTEHQTLTVGEIILNKHKESELKKQQS